MDAEIDLRAIFSFVRRQLRLVLIIFIAILGIAAVYIFTLTPIYTANTLVMVDPSDKNLLLDQNQTGPISASDARIEGEVLLAESDNVLLTVIDRENLIGSEEFQPQLGFTARVLSFLRLREPALPTPDQALRQTLNKLDTMVAVQRQRGTFLISLSASSEDPERAARIANAVAKAYIDTQLTAKVQSTIDARDVLMQQVSAARQTVVETDGSFDRFIENNLGTIIEQTNNTQLASLQAEISQLSTLRQSSASEVAALQTQLAQDDFTALSSRLADQAILQLEQERQDILGQIENGSAALSEVDLRGRLAGIEGELREAATTQIASLQGELQQTQASESTARQTLRTVILGAGLSSDQLTEIYDLQQRAELARQQYDQLLARAQQLQAEATLQLADSRVVSPALRPGTPSFPNTRTMLVLAALIGLVMGLAIAFVYEYFIGGIVSDEQLAAVAKKKMAQTVPKTRLEAGSTSVSDLLYTSPLSAFADSIRRIKTSIDQSVLNRVDTRLAPVIMVTSTAPGEGKTTLSLSIARAYALAGYQTLLVDCDLRRPSVHRQLGIEPSHSLVETLEAEIPTEGLREAIVNDEQTGLSVLIGSRRSIAATDQFITSRGFDRLISAARNTFEVIILDTPPLGPVVDGLYVARKADAVVMVVQWAQTPQQDVLRSLLALEQNMDESSTLIPVLNQQDMASSTYYRRYSSYYTESEGTT